VNTIPFSVYDFFGYLGAGFLLLATVDFAFDGGWIIHGKLEAVGFLTFFWILFAYIVGHIIANVSGYVIEKRLVRGILKSPEENLFGEGQSGGWARPFPGYFEPLPAATRKRILAKSTGKASIDEAGRALFFHCHAIAKRDSPTLERLNTFINIYGFCRNIAMACTLAVPVIFAGAFRGCVTGEPLYAQKLWWALLAGLVAIGMVYRYLKFFRHYTVEVFITYAECE
jgi:hypothetical protein